MVDHARGSQGVGSSQPLPHGAVHRVPARAISAALTLCAYALALACGGNGGPQPDPATVCRDPANRLATPPIAAHALAGRWLISYDDAKLGRVSGVAFINADPLRAQVDLFDPRDQRVYRLESVSFSIDGSTVEIDLAGVSPYAPLERPAGVTLIEPPAGTRDLRARAGSASTPGFLEPPTSIDADLVSLSFEADGAGSLSGSWSTFVDVITRRDGYGRGRIGTYEPSSGRVGIGIQTGREQWQKVVPQIVAVIPLEDATFRDHPNIANYRYPTTAPVARNLLVLGVNLPVDWREPAVFNTDDGAVRYMRARVSNDPPSPYYGPLFDKGWTLAGELFAPGDRADLRKLDAILVQVAIENGAVPGERAFQLNGAEGTWQMDFGDNHAELSFTRDEKDDSREGGKFESGSRDLDEIFVGETFHIEVRTNLAVPIGAIPLAFANGPSPAVGKDLKVIAYRVDGNPRLYRAGPFVALEQGAANPAPRATIAYVAPPDQLTATVAKRGLVRVVERGRARLEAPGMPLEATPHARATVGRPSGEGPFRNALHVAASCKQRQNENLDSLAGQETADVTNYVFTPTAAGRFKISISFADHAIMSMLKDELVRQLAEVDKHLPTLAAIDAPLLREQLAPQMQDPAFPLRAIKIDGPDALGLDVDYELAFDTRFDSPYFTHHFGNDVAAAQRWSDNAVVAGYAAYHANVKAALARARSTGICDIPALLKLTGLGYESLLGSLERKLVRRARHGGRDWEPDPVGLAALRSFGTFAQTVRAQKDMARADTDLLLACAGAGFGATSLFARASWFIVATTLLSTAEAGTSAAVVTDRFLLSREELELAEGALVVMGPSRLRDAQAREVGVGDLLLGAVVPVAGTGLGVFDAFAKLAQADAFLALATIEARGVASISELSPARLQKLRELLDVIDDLPLDTLTTAQRASAEKWARSSGAVRDTIVGAIDAGRSPPALYGIPRHFTRAKPELLARLDSTMRDTVPAFVNGALQGRSVSVQPIMTGKVCTGASLELGPLATAADVAQHAGTIRSFQRLSTLSGHAREMVAELQRRTLARGPPIPLTKAWYGARELEKLPAIIAARTRELARAGEGTATAAVLDREIASLQRQLEAAVEASRSTDPTIVARSVDARGTRYHLGEPAEFQGFDTRVSGRPYVKTSMGNVPIHEGPGGKTVAIIDTGADKKLAFKSGTLEEFEQPEKWAALANEFSELQKLAQAKCANISWVNLFGNGHHAEIHALNYMVRNPERFAGKDVAIRITRAPCRAGPELADNAFGSCSQALPLLCEEVAKKTGANSLTIRIGEPKNFGVGDLVVRYPP